MNVWKYANNGVISADGRSQLSGVDHARYLVRFDARLALVPCENFTTDHAPKVVIYLSQPMQFITENGPEDVTDAEKARIRNFLEIAMPVLGREVTFE